ncbi:MAG: prenyltransferase [Hydrogenophilus sp.]|nr:prenyltransferase [Hydrogenophilus sp.]
MRYREHGRRWQKEWRGRLQAVRWPFLLLSGAGGVLGVSEGLFRSGVAVEEVVWGMVGLAGAGVLLAHAAANVHNDYYDQGTDEINERRITPFTGGSRVLPEGIMTAAEMREWTVSLFAAAAGIGGAVVGWAGEKGAAWGGWLAAIGLGGVTVGWVYSAPPVRLVARGLGEVGVGIAWLGIVVGMALVTAAGGEETRTEEIARLATAAGTTALPFALLVALVLYVNEFPDAAADEATGKRTLPLRLREAAPWGYGAGVAAVGGLHVWLVESGHLPQTAQLGLAGLLPAVAAFWRLRRACPQAWWERGVDAAEFRRAAGGQLWAAHLYPLLTAGGLWVR